MKLETGATPVLLHGSALRPFKIDRSQRRERSREIVFRTLFPLFPSVETPRPAVLAPAFYAAFLPLDFQLKQGRRLDAMVKGWHI